MLWIPCSDPCDRFIICGTTSNGRLCWEHPLQSTRAISNGTSFSSSSSKAITKTHSFPPIFALETVVSSMDPGGLQVESYFWWDMYYLCHWTHHVHLYIAHVHVSPTSTALQTKLGLCTLRSGCESECWWQVGVDGCLQQKSDWKLGWVWWKMTQYWFYRQLPVKIGNKIGVFVLGSGCERWPNIGRANPGSVLCALLTRRVRPTRIPRSAFSKYVL